jgi:hypothetical protein
MHSPSQISGYATVYNSVDQCLTIGLVELFYAKRCLCFSILEAQRQYFLKTQDCREIQNILLHLFSQKNLTKIFFVAFFDKKMNNTFHRKFNCFPATTISVETLFFVGFCSISPTFLRK